MCDPAIILNKVTEFVSKEKLFTSVDIANAIKKGKIWVRNREVASWLRINMETMFDHYAKEQIQVANGKNATLYYPANKNPADYVTPDLRAISPKEFDAMKSDGAGTRTVTSQTISSKAKTLSTTSVNDTHLCNAQDRIRIPAAIVKVLDIKKGQEIEIEVRDRVGTTCASLKNFKVKCLTDDGRINVSKNPLNLAMPVKIFADNNKVILQEA